MEDKLRRYVDEIFEKTVPSKKAVELKEEMIQNLHDKYNDLIAEGKTPEAAYNIAIVGIGDVSGLLKELENDAIMPNIAELDAARQKSAMFTAIAVMMYILSVLPLIMLVIYDGRYALEIGVPIMFIMAAAATGLLIYNGMTKPRPVSSSDTIVEEFRAWQSDEKDRKAMRKSISSALWSLIVVIYFVISFTTQAWYISWIIFLIGAALESVINLFFSLKKRGG